MDINTEGFCYVSTCSNERPILCMQVSTAAETIYIKHTFVLQKYLSTLNAGHEATRQRFSLSIVPTTGYLPTFPGTGKRKHVVFSSFRDNKGFVILRSLLPSATALCSCTY